MQYHCLPALNAYGTHVRYLQNNSQLSMTALSVTGKVRKRFLEATVLLGALDEVRGVPAVHSLDCTENGDDRARFLKRKFLDSFALICANRKGGDSVSAACMEEGQPEGTIIRIACNSGVSEAVLSDVQATINILNKIACGGMY